MYTSALAKPDTNALQGWRAQMSHLPIASASMLVVATTSLVLALMNTCGARLASQGLGE